MYNNYGHIHAEIHLLCLTFRRLSLREVKQMSTENKSIFKKIAEKFGVGKEPEEPVEEISEPSDLAAQEEQAEESSVLPPQEISTEEVGPAAPQAEPHTSQLLEELISSQPEEEPSALEPEEVPQALEEEVIEEPRAVELPPQAPPVIPQPKVMVIATHTVRPNETLSHIALRYYGHATPPYYRLIYEFNRDVIGNNMNFIIPGQVLRIPSLPDNLKK